MGPDGRVRDVGSKAVDERSTLAIRTPAPGWKGLFSAAGTHWE